MVGSNINNLRCADDTMLLAESEDTLQAIMDEVNTAGKRYNMKMNAKKTKTMIITKKEDKPKIKTTIDGIDIEQVTHFTYLGQEMTEDGRCETEIKKRIGIAKSTFSKMSRVLTSKNIPLTTRKRILQCYVWSTLLYGAETWTISDAMAKRLSAFEMWTYRRMLKIAWTDKITNVVVLDRINIEKRLLTTIQTKKLKYFGHIIRHDSLHRTILDGKVNGSRGRGRPRTTWSTNICQWTDLRYHQAVRKAQRRDEWKTIASNPVQKLGTR